MEAFLVKKVQDTTISYRRCKTTLTRLGSRKIRSATASTTFNNVAEKKEKTLTFFSLPPEIRNRIYDETLISEEDHAVVLARAPYTEPALLRADSRIHDEAFKMYYSMNAFEVEDVDHALRFLQSLCTCVIPMLKSVRIPMVRCFGAYHASYLRREQTVRHHLCWGLIQSGLLLAGLRPDCILLGIDSGHQSSIDGHSCMYAQVSFTWISCWQFDLLAAMVNSQPRNGSEIGLVRTKAVYERDEHYLLDAQLNSARREIAVRPCKDRYLDCLRSPRAIANSQVLRCEPKFHDMTASLSLPGCTTKRHVPLGTHFEDQFFDAEGIAKRQDCLSERLYYRDWIDWKHRELHCTMCDL